MDLTNNEQEKKALLKEIMKIDFVNIETVLYLDTHPMDSRMIAEHNKYSRQLDMLKKQYQQKFGPLTFYDMSNCPWAYIEEPWPWEINY